jgi:hypothetical protein
MIMWRPDLHPRDQYGRFRLKGMSGVYDRLAGGVEAYHHGKLINEWQANSAQQERYWYAREAGQLTPEQNADWDVLAERAAQIRDQIPRAYWMGLRPHGDGTWRNPERPGVEAFDERGRRIPLAAIRGWIRVGDDPRRREVGRGERVMHNDVGPMHSPLSGGVWHKPGETLPGGLPNLRSDYGAPYGEQAVRELAGLRKKPKTREHRDEFGAFGRAEVRAERGVSNRVTRLNRDEYRGGDVVGAKMISPLNPTGRRRSARVKRKREQTVTWIQRVNEQMENRRG